MRYLITIFFYFLLQSNTFATPVKDFTARYNLYHSGFYIGQSKKSLTTKNDFLTFSSISKTAGVAAWFFDITVTETSKLQFKNNRLNFFSYSYVEEGKDKNESIQLHLEQPQSFYNSHTKKRYPVAKNLHDVLGFTVSIMHDLQAGKREIKYTIAEKSKIRIYTLKLIQKEELATYKGKISTLKMEHYDPQTKTRFTLWCAENMGFLPIRIRKINYKGKVVLLNLTHFNQQAIDLILDEDEDEDEDSD